MKLLSLRVWSEIDEAERTRIMERSTHTIFDPDLKTWLDRLQQRLDEPVVLPREIGLPAGRYVINGVDVTAYVNERDPWYPLRAMLRPSDPAGMRATCAALGSASASMDRRRP